MTTANPFSLAGKVAVVTGGSSGIGAASVRLLAGAGARVVVGYNKGADRAAALIAELPGNGHQAMYLPLEDSAQIRKVAAAVEDGFGRADILVNSAGFTRMVAHNDLDALALAAHVRADLAQRRLDPPLLVVRGHNDAQPDVRHLCPPRAEDAAEPARGPPDLIAAQSAP